MKFILGVIALQIVFILILLLFRVKAFTLHLCLAGRIYWVWSAGVKKVNEVDTVYTVQGGPISFVVIR